MLIPARSADGKHVLCTKFNEKHAKLIVKEVARVAAKWSKQSAAQLQECAPEHQSALVAKRLIFLQLQTGHAVSLIRMFSTRLFSALWSIVQLSVHLSIV